MKDLLLHICCGPCAIHPVHVLRERSMEFTGLFFNPNIHPFLEFERRVEALEEISQALEFPVIHHPMGYGLVSWLNVVWSRHPERPDRCRACYAMRLEETANLAKDMGFKGFSTTLLYSIYQDHQAIKNIGLDLQARMDIEFIYMDFRSGWKEGKKKARQTGIYMQPYCGCIMSEAERYEKRIKRLKDRFKAGQAFSLSTKPGGVAE